MALPCSRAPPGGRVEWGILQASPNVAASRRAARPHVTRSQRGDSPYEPLERAVQVINRVISVGQKAQWGNKSAGGDASGDNEEPGQERWVQFGAVSSAQTSVQEPEEPAAAPQAPGWLPGRGGGSGRAGQEQQQGAAGAAAGGGRGLRAYLALPVDQYSLLDPKWISREPGGSFRFSIPLQDLVGVDLCPTVFITVRSDPAARRVTLVGTRAAIGSPEVDEAFKLNLVAVLSDRQPRRLSIPRPTHIPGRPVYRLRRWAARARGRQWPPGEDGAGDQAAAGSSATAAAAAAGEEQSAAAGAPMEVPLEGLALEGLDVDDPGTAAPFPRDLIYYSRDDGSEGSEGSDSEDAVAGTAEDSMELLSTAAAVQQAPSSTQRQQGDASASSASQSSSQLHCRVNLTMALRVPGPLRVVPNALLGYAGSLLLRAVLAAALPNFVDLLAGDYERWTRAEGGQGERDVDAQLGDIFSSPAAASEATAGSEAAAVVTAAARSSE